MDEPFGALDAQTREILLKDLLDIWQETQKTLLFVTHSIEEATYLSENVSIITSRSGRIEFDRDQAREVILTDDEYEAAIWEARVGVREELEGMS